MAIFASAKRADGSPPSALREMVLNVDKDIEVDMRGLPVCEGGGLHRRKSLDEVIRECRQAIVGSGQAKVMVSFAQQAPIRVSTRLAAFNLGIPGGVRTLSVLGAIRIPVPALIVTRVELRRKGRGWRAVVKIPRIVGGAGSLTAFRLNLKRFFFYRGERKSFLSARCPDGRFKITTPKAVFENETNAPGVAPRTIFKGSLLVPCRARG